VGAAGALERAGNVASLDDGVVHPTIDVDELDRGCEVPGRGRNERREGAPIDAILNNSFGMLGINSALIVTKV